MKELWRHLCRFELCRSCHFFFCVSPLNVIHSLLYFCDLPLFIHFLYQCPVLLLGPLAALAFPFLSLATFTFVRLPFLTSRFIKFYGVPFLRKFLENDLCVCRSLRPSTFLSSRLSPTSYFVHLSLYIVLSDCLSVCLLVILMFGSSSVSLPPSLCLLLLRDISSCRCSLSVRLPSHCLSLTLHLSSFLFASYLIICVFFISSI